MSASSSNNQAIGTTQPGATELLTVDIQIAVDEPGKEEPPSREALTRWAKVAYQSVRSSASEVTIRLVDSAEMTSLNHRYRGKESSTNVLSFGCDIGPEPGSEMEVGLLGDIVLCHSVILNEAQQQQKSTQNHYAHMVVHGILHLCGYEHQTDKNASSMESCEVQILTQIGIANPYIE